MALKPVTIVIRATINKWFASASALILEMQNDFYCIVAGGMVALGQCWVQIQLGDFWVEFWCMFSPCLCGYSGFPQSKNMLTGLVHYVAV